MNEPQYVKSAEIEIRLVDQNGELFTSLARLDKLEYLRVRNKCSGRTLSIAHSRS